MNIIRHFKQYSVAVVGILILSSCSMYQKPEVPPVVYPEKFKIDLPESKIAINERWWENFSNPDLNKIVEKALVNNKDYLIALQNIEIAQTYVSQSMTGLYPQLGATSENSRNKDIITVGSAVSAAPDLTQSNSIFNLQYLAATVSYEFDVWNQVHNEVDQAKMDKIVAQENANVIKLTLISGVVNTYFQILAAEENIKHIQAQYKAAKQILLLYRAQLNSGLIDDSIVYVAENEIETLKISLQNLKKQKQILEYTLAYLAGEYPENNTIKINGKIENINYKALIPAGLPSTMIAQRPDIQAAYASVLSYGYIEKQALANFFPVFSLTASYGYASQTLGSLFNAQNSLWSYGLDGLINLVDYPALMSQYDRSKIQYKTSVLTYMDTLLNAFKEVDSALISYQEDRQAMQSYVRQEKNERSLLSIAKAQYAAGLTDEINYLTHKIDLLDTQISLINQQVLVTQDVVETYKTLGLGLRSITTIEQPDENESKGDRISMQEPQQYTIVK